LLNGGVGWSLSRLPAFLGFCTFSIAERLLGPPAPGLMTSPRQGRARLPLRLGILAGPDLSSAPGRFGATDKPDTRHQSGVGPAVRRRPSRALRAHAAGCRTLPHDRRTPLTLAHASSVLPAPVADIRFPAPPPRFRPPWGFPGSVYRHRPEATATPVLRLARLRSVRPRGPAPRPEAERRLSWDLVPYGTCWQGGSGCSRGFHAPAPSAHRV
jgi:hypothetical protein